jgi:hypothetical protein
VGENFWLLIFIFFVLAPILERVLKGGKRPPPRGQQRPRERRIPQTRSRLPGEPPPAGGTQRSGTETAADVLPPELWELLTGQKPPARVPPRQPAPEDQWDEEADRDEADQAAATIALPPAPSDEERQVTELLKRREREALRPVERSYPQIVTLETAPLPPAARHREFHRRIDKVDAKKAAPAMEAPEAARDIIADILQDGSMVDIRRAILMQEVLGPPKGLE